MVKGEERELAASYVEEGADYRAITIHPLQRHQKQNRLKTGQKVTCYTLCLQKGRKIILRNPFLVCMWSTMKLAM